VAALVDGVKVVVAVAVVVGGTNVVAPGIALVVGGMKVVVGVGVIVGGTNVVVPGTALVVGGVKVVVGVGVIVGGTNVVIPGTALVVGGVKLVDGGTKVVGGWVTLPLPAVVPTELPVLPLVTGTEVFVPPPVEVRATVLPPEPPQLESETHPIASRNNAAAEVHRIKVTDSMGKGMRTEYSGWSNWLNLARETALNRDERSQLT
jgi:hypothetical protein